jgi:hypothetical protein
MEAVLASVIAVTGTLLGSIITFVFQRRASERSEVVTRAERLRQERLATYSNYAGTITALKQAIIALWFLLQRDPDGSPTLAAFTECDRLGAAVESALFRVQLVAEDPALVALAVVPSDAIDPLRRSETRAELSEREAHCLDALNSFIAAASRQIH